MTNFPMIAEVSFFMGFLAVVWVLTALVLILIVLVQKGKGGGLSGAFGGAGGGAGLLGTKTGDFLTWVTISLVVLFFILAIILGKYYRPLETKYGDETTTPAAPATQPIGDVSPADPTKAPDAADALPGTDAQPTEVPVKTEDIPGTTDNPVTE